MFWFFGLYWFDLITLLLERKLVTEGNSEDELELWFRLTQIPLIELIAFIEDRPLWSWKTPAPVSQWLYAEVNSHFPLVYLLLLTFSSLRGKASGALVAKVIFAIPFCQELSFQQKGYQIKSIQNQNPKHKTLQQVVLGTLRFQRTRQNKSIIKSTQPIIYNRLWASFGWKIVIRTNEQRTQRKERFLKKPTCKQKAWVRKSAKWNANFGGR